MYNKFERAISEAGPLSLRRGPGWGATPNAKRQTNAERWTL